MTTRLYKIESPGGHRQADLMIERTEGLGYPLNGSGVLGDTAFVQLRLETDADASRAALAIVGPVGWKVRTGYGIHQRSISTSEGLDHAPAGSLEVTEGSPHAGS